MLTRHFLNPNSPLIDSVTDFLLELGDELKDTLVIVPTAQSGRKLREHLPKRAGRTILAPAVTTPEVLYAPQNSTKIADKIQWWFTWSHILRSYSDEQLEDLFPKLESIERDFNWGLNAAQRFCKLKEEITSADHSFGSVATFSEEKSRWQLLAQIDRDVKDRLSELKLHCPSEAKRYAAENWKAPARVKRIILACTPDLPTLARKALSNKTAPVDVLIHASEQLSDTFSELGVPYTSYWNETALDLHGQQEELIKLDASGHDCAESLITNLANYQSDQIALAVTDKEFSGLISDALDKAGWKCFDPEGRSLSRTGLWAFLRLFKLNLTNSHSFQHVQSLLKCPEARYLLKSIQSPATIAAKIDILTQKALPQNFNHAISRSDEVLRPVLEELQAWLTQRSDHSSRFLEKLFDRLERSPDFPTELIDPFIDGIETIKSLESQNAALSYIQALDLVMASCEGIKLQPDRAGTVIDQLGWLETPYSDAPHLRIVGLHEGHVPEQAHDDGFLPESLRKQIQLYSREQLAARDSFLFHSLIQARKDTGSSLFFLSQTTPSGEERQCSRLLMRCPNEELPARVQHCFSEEIEGKKNLPAYSAGDWSLKLKHDLQWPSDKVVQISPSKLANFLRCPFRFYLQYIEEFQRSDFDSQEMDAMQFGNLVHDTLEIYGRDEALKDLSDAKEIHQAFSDVLDDLFTKRYGHDSNLPLTIQKESALNRLQAFAQQQAQLRAEGWQIKYVELAIGPKEDIQWSVNGAAVNMRIDRIDVHEATGAWRVIDYKTSTKVKKPEEEHFENSREIDEAEHCYGELLPPAPRRRSQRRWKNLQLPLYAEFVRDHFQLESLPEIAYVAFPAAASHTGLQAWSGYDEATHENAMQWTYNCIDAIRSSKFPIRELPSTMRSWDDFAALSPTHLVDAFNLHTS